jgi:hypothetical protein
MCQIYIRGWSRNAVLSNEIMFGKISRYLLYWEDISSFKIFGYTNADRVIVIHHLMDNLLPISCAYAPLPPGRCAHPKKLLDEGMREGENMSFSRVVIAVRP